MGSDGRGDRDGGIGAVLDHVAVAAERVADLWPRYAGELAGQWLGGGETAGFYSAQVAYANGMKLEGLEPRRIAESDFLRRFLDRNGPGPHHLTFRVPDIGAAIDAATDTGFPPVSINLTDPDWMEAFLHPKAACGVVVQLAQAEGSWDGPLPAPPAVTIRTEEPARLDRVTHAVRDLPAARRLFQELLGGAVTDESQDHDAEWVELSWDGGGCLRLVAPRGEGPLAAWIGDRPGRLHHIAFTTARPNEMAGARPATQGGPAGPFEVPPEANLGVRLLVSPG